MIIPKVLKTYSTVENTFLLYALCSLPLKKYETIFSIKNLSFPYSLFNKILKVLQARNKHKKSVLYSCENFQLSTLREI